MFQRKNIGIAILAAAVCLSTAMAQGNGNGNGQGNDNGQGQNENGNSGKVHEIAPPTRAGSVPAGTTGVQSPPITNHGGPVMGTPNVYVIWYGNWNQGNGTDTAAGQAIVNDFLYGLSGSPYFMINSTYGGVSGLFQVKGSTSDNYSQGRNLTDSRVGNVVASAITSNRLPLDANGVYFVLSSSDVAETSGFCSRYCGWHTYGYLNWNNTQTNIKYSFIGNAARCLNACAIQSTSPNGNAGVDGMVSVLAHELEEADTDPNLNAWYDSKGAENGDKCAWTFGANLPSNGGAFYNLTLNKIAGGTRNFLIQRDLSATDSKCYVGLNGAQ